MDRQQMGLNMSESAVVLHRKNRNREPGSLSRIVLALETETRGP